ncbi:MAG: response regulator [Gammaproteobacteria bacterium]|nr:MAG: response regulator [Gammaproteobacteria bacterium]
MKRLLQRWCPLFLLALACAYPARSCLAARPSLPAGLDLAVAMQADPEGRLTFAQVRRRSAAWPARPLPLPGQGIGETVYWVRIALVNRLDRPRRLVVELDQPTLDRIEYGLERPGHPFLRGVTGDRLPFAHRPLPARDFVFPVKVSAHGRAVLYLRIQSTADLQFPLRVQEYAHWAQRRLATALCLGAFYGLMLAMALYNLFVGSAARDAAYLYYAGFILCLALLGALTDGTGFQYLWPGVPGWQNAGIPLVLALSNLLAVQLARAFLPLRERQPARDRIARQQAGVAFVLVVAAAAFPLAPRFVTQLELVYTLVLLVLLGLLGLEAYRGGFRPARFFLLALLASVLIVFVRIGYAFGWLPVHLLTAWSLHLGAALQVLLVSFAFADRLDHMRREKQAAQQQAIENLRRADQIKDRILANTSHELRTPVQAILGLGEMLLSTSTRLAAGGTLATLAEGCRRHADLIVENARWLAQLIDELLDYARLRGGRVALNLQPLALHPLVNIELALLTGLPHSDAVRLENGVPEDLPPVLADERALRQVFHNLLANALRHTTSGRIAVHARPTGSGRVEVEVIDTGTGMPPERLEGIFSPPPVPDEEAARPPHGHGLGLGIARALVRELGGELEVESREGAGTRVRFTLPVSRSPAPEGGTVLRPVVPAEEGTQPAASRPSMAPSSEASVEAETPVPETTAPMPLVPARSEEIRILVVEDDLLQARLLESFLTAHGYVVELAGTGREALELFRAWRPRVVLLDVMLPELDGFEVCRRIRREADETETAILMLSARGQREDVLRGFACGADDYLVKPVERQELLARVRTQLRVRKAYEDAREVRRLHREIRRRRQVEDRLRAARRRLAMLLEAEEDAILCLDEELRVTYANRAALEYFGYDREALDGLGIERLCDLEEAGVFVHEPQGWVITGEIERLAQARRVRCLPRSGPAFPALIFVARLAGADEPGYGIIVRPLHPAGAGVPADEAQLIQDGRRKAAALREALPDASGLPPTVEAQAQVERETFRRLLVEVMQLSLECWEKTTGTGKVELAEQSGLWRVYLDKSTFVTRTLDKYLRLATLPRRPRWRTVLKTAEFVLARCEDEALRERLAGQVQKLRRLALHQ